jgi:hypothetical protein
MNEKNPLDFNEYFKYLARYEQIMSPQEVDVIYPVLRTHLFVEELMHDYISKIFKNPDALEGSHLSFSQVVCLVKASNEKLTLKFALWPALNQLNSIRNQLAHKIEAKNISKKIKSFIDFIKKEMEIEDDLYPDGASESRRFAIDLHTTLSAVAGALTATLVHDLKTKAELGKLPKNS